MPPNWRFRMELLVFDQSARVWTVLLFVYMPCTMFKVHGKSTFRVYFPIFQNSWMHIVHSYHHCFSNFHSFIRAIPSFAFELLSERCGAVEKKGNFVKRISRKQKVKMKWNIYFFPQILRMRFVSVCFLLLLLLPSLRSLFGLWGETECVRVR